MSFVNKYPYTDFHELNLDFVLDKLHELGFRMDEFEAVNKITFSGAWNITAQYPAWTVVTDNNLGYISVKPVPAGVLLTNTDYWALIVDYSAELAGIHNDINDLQLAVAGNIVSINAINAELAAGKWLFIGDSYQNYGDWYSKVLARLGLISGTDAFYCGGSGHGFTVSGSEWLTDYNTFCSGRTDLAEFKNVVIVGGLNDSTDAAIASDGAAIRSAVASFMASVVNNMPNAITTFAYVGAGLSDSAYIADRGNYNRQYACNVFRDLFTQYKRRFIENTKYCLYTATNFDADGVHPAPTGAFIIANAVAEYLLSGNCKIVGHTETGYDNQPFASGQLTCYQGFANEVENGRVRTVLRMVTCPTITTLITANATGVDVGAIPSSCYVRNSQPVPCVMQRSNSGGARRMNAYVQMKNGHLYLFADELVAGPAYDALNFNVGDRMDLGTLTFDEFVDYSL